MGSCLILPKHGAQRVQGKALGGCPLVCGALWWPSLMNGGHQEIWRTMTPNDSAVVSK